MLTCSLIIIFFPEPFSELLWVAPELLPVTVVPGSPATQKGDVYSFSIILEEIVVRGGPYEVAKQFLSTKGKKFKHFGWFYFHGSYLFIFVELKQRLH